MDIQALKELIAFNIRKIRTSKQITQEKLALLTGIDRRQIQRIEAAQIDMRLSTLNRIGTALGCGMDELVGE